jgi:hypothetical protein
MKNGKHTNWGHFQENSFNLPKTRFRHMAKKSYNWESNATIYWTFNKTGFNNQQKLSLHLLTRPMD